MADSTDIQISSINQLDDARNLSSDDYLYIAQKSGNEYLSKKTKIDDLYEYVESKISQPTSTVPIFKEYLIQYMYTNISSDYDNTLNVLRRTAQVNTKNIENVGRFSLSDVVIGQPGQPEPGKFGNYIKSYGTYTTFNDMPLVCFSYKNTTNSNKLLELSYDLNPNIYSSTYYNTNSLLPTLDFFSPRQIFMVKFNSESRRDNISIIKFSMKYGNNTTRNYTFSLLDNNRANYAANDSIRDRWFYFDKNEKHFYASDTPCIVKPNEMVVFLKPKQLVIQSSGQNYIPSFNCAWMYRNQNKGALSCTNISSHVIDIVAQVDTQPSLSVMCTKQLQLIEPFCSVSQYNSDYAAINSARLKIYDIGSFDDESAYAIPYKNNGITKSSISSVQLDTQLENSGQLAIENYHLTPYR